MACCSDKKEEKLEKKEDSCGCGSGEKEMAGGCGSGCGCH